MAQRLPTAWVARGATAARQRWRAADGGPGPEQSRGGPSRGQRLGRLPRAWLLSGLLFSIGFGGPALAQKVSLAGSMGTNRALLLIDGQPLVLAVGASAQGVTLQRLGDSEATVLVDGRVLQLRLGATPGTLGTPGPAATAASQTIVLPMGPGGHFLTAGSINGRQVQFVVDTGATSVALSQSEATRIGLDWRSGRPAQSQTANGVVPVHAVVLRSVRVGDVELANVAAVVVPAEMGPVLLGNSFLNRFTMQRTSDVMRLERKP